MAVRLKRPTCAEAPFAMKPTLFARSVVTFSAAIACASLYAAIPKGQDISRLAAEVVATKPAAIQN